MVYLVSDGKPEEKKPDEKPVEETPKNIVAAHEAAEHMDKASERMEKATISLERMRTDKIIAGDIDSGTVSEEVKKTDAAADYFKGTQLEIDIRKANE